MPTIPYDMYESPQELIIIIPFWGVDKESIKISIKYETISITGKRLQPKLRNDFHLIQQQCFRWDVELFIDLPPHANYKQMNSNLSKENILTLIIPKNLIPDSIPVHIEE